MSLFYSIGCVLKFCYSTRCCCCCRCFWCVIAIRFWKTYSTNVQFSFVYFERASEIELDKKNTYIQIVFHIGQNSIYLRIQETRQDSYKTVCLCVCVRMNLKWKTFGTCPFINTFIDMCISKITRIYHQTIAMSKCCGFTIIKIRRNENHIERDECPYRYIILHKSH